MIKFVFVFLCAAAFSAAAFGQNMDADLKKSFNKNSIVKIDNREALQKAESGIPFKIKRTLPFSETERGIC